MKKILSFLFTVLVVYYSSFAQKIDKVKFFAEESTVNVNLEFDMKDLLAKKALDRYLPGTVTMTFKDGSTVTQKTEVTARGNFRRESCFMPGLKLNFKRADSTGPLAKFKEVKLTNGCSPGDDPGQLVVKEYLAYRIYNLLTDMSLRVRFLNISFKDVSGKRKPYTQYGFLIEDIDDMAKRNKMVEVEGTQYYTEQTNRDQMTLVTLFQYLIGNTDWSVPAYHNVKLIGPKEDKNVRPYVVAYDFDICGLVDPPYATIDEQLQDKISSVRERLNRGFPRTMEELKIAVGLFNDRKEKIVSLVKNNEHLSSRNKSNTVQYIEDFYKTINDDRELKRIFVDGGRTASIGSRQPAVGN
ncbi:MAG TPA: hypothetical protein VFP97_02630 [Chitinophagaceae bacterium]|nr:hypothetical protein [Chitinophagaceae bacterium]